MKEAVAYIRVSSKAQEAEGYSIDAQRKSLQRFAKKNGFVIVKEFLDVVSASKPGRSQFNAMVKFIEDEAIEHILVDNLDRLSRNVTDLGTIVQLIEDGNITLHICTDNGKLSKDSHPYEQYMGNQKVIAAKLENDLRALRAKTGMLEKAEQGKYPSCAPFGYVNCEKNGKRDIGLHPKEAPSVQKIFELAAASYSIARITEIMTKEGMVCRNGQPPYHSFIAKILKNKFYTGGFKWKGTWYPNASHKALVSEELFELVQKMMRKPNQQKSRKSLFAYTNLIVCGACRSAITAEIKKERYIYYHCTGSKGACNKVHIREEVIEEQIVVLLRGIHVPEEIHDAICASIKELMQEEIDYHTSTIWRIEKQLLTLKNRKNEALAAMLDKKIDEEVWKERDTAWDLEREQLTASLLEHQKFATDYTKQIELMLQLPQRAAQLFRRGSVEQKRKILGILFSRCVLDDKRLELEFNAPFYMLTNSLSHEVTAV